MNETTQPLVSCLCISKNTHLLSRSIECFQKQSYANKELLIVYSTSNTPTGELLAKINDPQIRSFAVTDFEKITLGELRNLSVEKSNGQYFCQWDDDDWYYRTRIECQMDGLLRSCKKASILVYEIVFHEQSKTAYRSPMRPWEHSIICEKSFFSKSLNYSAKNMGEDADFVNKLLKKKEVYPVVMPQLYIYVYHGRNTVGEAHFDKIFSNSIKLPKSASLVIHNVVAGKLSYEEACRQLNSPQFLTKLDYFGFV